MTINLNETRYLVVCTYPDGTSFAREQNTADMTVRSLVVRGICDGDFEHVSTVIAFDAKGASDVSYLVAAECIGYLNTKFARRVPLQSEINRDALDFIEHYCGIHAVAYKRAA